MLCICLRVRSRNYPITFNDTSYSNCVSFGLFSGTLNILLTHTAPAWVCVCVVSRVRLNYCACNMQIKWQWSRRRRSSSLGNNMNKKVYMLFTHAIGQMVLFAIVENLLHNLRNKTQTHTHTRNKHSCGNKHAVYNMYNTHDTPESCL